MNHGQSLRRGTTSSPSATAFREVMAAVPAPVTILTAASDHGRPHGTTVSSFSSLSLDPPMIFAALNRDSNLLAIIRSSRRFGVNVLSSDQVPLAVNFAGKGPDKFQSVAFTLHEEVPRIAGVTGWLACDLADLIDGGDHLILVGTVLAAETVTGRPLTYHARRFGTHAALDLDP